MFEIVEKRNLGMFGGVEYRVEHIDYSAFGKILSIKDGNGNDVTDAPPVNQSFTYTGREYDSESGLYYYRARYYDANIGRFLQVDPVAGNLRNPITHINKYSYVGNNPANYFDPSGKFRLGQILAIGGVIGLIDPGNILKWVDEHSNQVLGAALVVGGAFVTGATFGGATPLGVAMMGAGYGLATTKQGAPIEDIEANMITGAAIGLAIWAVPGSWGGLAKVGVGAAAGFTTSAALGGNRTDNMNNAIKGAAAGALDSLFGPTDTSSQSGQVPSSGSSSSHGCTIDSDKSGNCK